MSDWLQYMEAGRRQRQENLAIQRQNQLAQLASKAYMAPADKQQGLIQSAIGVNPDAGFALSTNLQQDRTTREDRSREILGYSARLLTSVPQEARAGVYAKVRPQLESLGMQNLPMTYEENPTLIDQTAQGIAQSVMMTGAPAGMQEFNALTAGLTPEERARAQRVRLGIEGRAPSAGMQWQKVQIGDTEYLVRTNPMTGTEEFATIGADGMPQMGGQPQGGPMSIPVPGGQIDVADPAAAEFLRQNPSVMRGLSSGQPFDVAVAPAPSMGGAPSGVLAATNTVDLAARTAGAQEQARLGAQLAAAPAQAAVAANLERVRELAKGEAGRENDRLANRTGMIIALNQADQSTAAMRELVQTSIEPMVSNWTTGTLGSFLSAIPGTSASNFEANLETLKAVAGFSELTALKARGGTLGALSEGERAALESLWGTLRNSQSPEAFRANLNRYMLRVEQAWQNIANEYEARYGESATGAVGNFRSGTAGALGGSQGQGKQVRRTGTLNGRRVVEYTDGSVEYGD